MKNLEGLTPNEVFRKAHENLKKDGEQWMKDKANYCMIVATLIATVMFAAAITVPGGNDQTIGTPIFFEKELVYSILHFRCNRIVFLFNFNSIFLVNSHIPLQRKGFLKVITFKVDTWTCHTLHFHGGHDVSLYRNFLFGVSKRKDKD